MKNTPLLIGTIVGTLILIVVAAFAFSSETPSGDAGQLIDPSIAMGESRHVKAGEPVFPELAEITEEAMESTQSSEVEEIITIVEFSDFQCPACKAALPAVDAVMTKYPGQVELIYRHFPLDSIHPNARLAATAAEAVASIDSEKFWGMHDLLFEHQAEWSNVKSRSELKDIFVTYVEELSIDRNEFIERIEDKSVAQVVANDSNVGNELGVNSTPTFYVNGIKTSAPQLLTTVESLINSNE